MKSILLSLVSLLFVSCLSDTEKPSNTDYTVQNEKEIVDYIAANKLIAQKSSTGLYYVINEAGTGAQPTASSNVTVAYKGYYTNGNVFDKSSDEGISFGLNQVIKGWTEGIPYFKEGGSGILLIPSALGYGSNGSGPIPGGAVILFDVKLIKVN
ncbi:FKBP-type peptidyl-prolyl cis-trans isomerase [uncultured Flavobacterium sp.]|uniref:FKBP-type peptidyl-prolyl cis-trans isomerase n=1 Tax=uncultured Flavobacterium sp. TaxID=165435 RepID=UPI0030EDB421|tara:strand:- start:14971 stop:15432 length:462 start_codon:yes stop_codon:yes gene_type:complete